METEKRYTTTVDTEESDYGAIPLTTVPVMGALMGFLLILLGFVITGWAWTCWTLIKVKKAKIQVR